MFITSIVLSHLICKSIVSYSPVCLYIHHSSVDMDVYKILLEYPCIFLISDFKRFQEDCVKFENSYWLPVSALYACIAT